MLGTEATRGELEGFLAVDVSPALLELALTHRSYAYEHGGLATGVKVGRTDHCFNGIGEDGGLVSTAGQLFSAAQPDMPA